MESMSAVSVVSVASSQYLSLSSCSYEDGSSTPVSGLEEFSVASSGTPLCDPGKHSLQPVLSTRRTRSELLQHACKFNITGVPRHGGEVDLLCEP